MTASLPDEVQAVLHRFITTELTTVTHGGQPIGWQVMPYYRPGDPCIDVTTALGVPQKAKDARANPLVALLFSDPTGSDLNDPPAVLVQGTAEVDDRDLQANRVRYERDSVEKLPATGGLAPPVSLKRFMRWYYTRIYIHVRPERVYVWPRGDIAAEPALYDAHMEEVRSGHSEEPSRFHADPAGGISTWDERLAELGSRYPTAVLSLVSPDGFPFAVRVPVAIDPAARWIRIEGAPSGIPFAPGLACLTAHERAAEFGRQHTFQVRGDLVAVDHGWALIPHQLVAGFELRRTRLRNAGANAVKAWRFHRIAQRELARRAG
jgi:Pyridoxamine 5'-phosphate oxidase